MQRAVKALIKHNKKFLIIKPTNPMFIGPYDLPGGRIEGNEDKKEALKREVSEETGLDIEIIKELCTETVKYPHIELSLTTFLCSASRNDIKLSHEHKEFIWVTKEELLELPERDWLPKKYIKTV